MVVVWAQAVRPLPGRCRSRYGAVDAGVASAVSAATSPVANPWMRSAVISPSATIVEDRIGHRDLLATRRNTGEVTRVSADEDYFRRSRALANDHIRQLRGRIESLLVQLDDRTDHLVPPLDPLADVDQLKDHIVAEVRGDVLAGHQRGDVGIDDRLRLLDAHGHRRRRGRRRRFRHRCCHDPQRRRGSGHKGRGDHGDHAEATRHQYSSNTSLPSPLPRLSSPPTWDCGVRMTRLALSGGHLVANRLRQAFRPPTYGVGRARLVHDVPGSGSSLSAPAARSCGAGGWS